MRIALFVPYLYRFKRGIETSACRLASALVEQGHEVTLLTWSQRTGTAEATVARGVRVWTVPYFRYFRPWIAVPFNIRFLRQGRFDLVNIYFADCGEAVPIRMTKQKLGYRLQFIAGYPPELVPHRYDAFDRLGLTPLLDRVVAKSPAMVFGLEKRMGRPTVMIPNGVDAGHFEPTLFPKETCRRELGLDRDVPVLVTVAALEERKGIQHVLRALPTWISRNGPICYLVVGEGSLRDSLQREASELGLNGSVRLMGGLTDVRPVLAASDGFALPSHGEGFPNALLEAWAMDLPALVSRHPPYPDIVEDELGSMVNEEDTESMLAGLADVLLYSRSRTEGSRRRHVIENYSWSRVAQQITA